MLSQTCNFNTCSIQATFIPVLTLHLRKVFVCAAVSVMKRRVCTKSEIGFTQMECFSCVGGLQGCRQTWQSNCWDSSILAGADTQLLSPLLHNQLLISSGNPHSCLNGWPRMGPGAAAALGRNFDRSDSQNKCMCCTPLPLGVWSHCGGYAS